MTFATAFWIDVSKARLLLSKPKKVSCCDEADEKLSV